MISSSRPRPYRLSSGGDSSPMTEAAAGRLGRLPRARRERIAALTGSPHADAASLIDHLSKREVARDLLRSLSPSGLLAARFFVEAHDLLPRAVAEREMEARLGEAAGPALTELDKLGLLLECKWAGGAKLLGLLPPLPRSMRPFLWLLGDEADGERFPEGSPPERVSLGLVDLRRLVLVMAAVAAEPPRLARDGGAHGSDIARLHRERLEPTFSELSEVESLVARLFSLSLLAGDAEGRVRVRWKRAEALMALPSASRLPLLLSTDELRTREPRAPGMASASRVRRLLCAGLADLPRGFWARGAALEAAVRLRLMASDTATPYGDLDRMSRMAGNHVRLVMKGLGACLETHGTGEDLWLRLPLDPPAGEEAGWLVQPDHEIIIPPEVGDLDLVRLSSVADLARADVVALFHIGPQSTARAVESGLDAAKVLERLASRAARGLPEGLEIQVRDWVRQAGAKKRRPLSPDEEAESFFGTGPDKDARPRGVQAPPPHLRRQTPSLPGPQRESFGPGIFALRDELGARLLEG